MWRVLGEALYVVVVVVCASVPVNTQRGDNENPAQTLDRDELPEVSQWGSLVWPSERLTHL